ncbi:MAG: YdcF family protein, partial [Firmicutes bacterium]|nr:YdcF family protein [Bacillota bacterium]
VLVAAAGLVFTIGVLYAYVEWFGSQVAPRKGDVIIVLGAAVWPDGPSPALLERIALAEALYHQGYAPVIITTGGPGNFNPAPEGRVAREVLVARGLPEEAVLEETLSRNTRKNLAGAYRLMQQHGWHRAVIVSHDFHLWRALREARKLGIEASGAGVHETALVRPPLVLREVFANMACIARR